MDVDSDADFFPPSSAGQRATLRISEAHRTAFDNEMRRASRYFGSTIDDAGDDDSEWKTLFSDVLQYLTFALERTNLKDAVIPPSSTSSHLELVNTFSNNEMEEWKTGVRKGVKDNDWGDLIAHPKLQVPFDKRRTKSYQLQLGEAYSTPFVGPSATDFIEFLRRNDEEVRNGFGPLLAYAKAVSIVQSSGTGKSRTLTQVGSQLFTLPICLRTPTDPGYPPSDVAVYNYFKELDNQNDLSGTAHIRIACFLCVAHRTMLSRLKEKQEQPGCSAVQLLKYWHDLMEGKGQRKGREQFFADVVKGAKSMLRHQAPMCETPSPRGDKTSFDIETAARKVYERDAKKATEDLINFLNTIGVENVLCVTYFDEADVLGQLFWITMRLVSNQADTTPMWYVFMATKSKISYFKPVAKNLSSLRLKSELKQLIPPYFALGFDQNVIENGQKKKRISVGQLQTVQHLCDYGRPLWRALFLLENDEVITSALLKLTNGPVFNSRDKDHVLAVLSHRLCIEPVLVGAEAIALADRSVAQHMRLLTGDSPNFHTSYTYSPSEPVLALAAFEILYKIPKSLGMVLNTFSRSLCEAGLVETGLIGELGGRTLLLIARDFTVIKGSVRSQNLLQPVTLLAFLDELFAATTWCGAQHRVEFEKAFGNAFVNFTHWVVTKDPLPRVPDEQLLANLYARGAALQCAFNQESGDFLIPVYMGPSGVDATFDPEMVSALVAQIKYKTKGDKMAGSTLRPIGIPRDLSRPLPYLALLMELGTESSYRETGSKVTTTIPNAVHDGEFRKLTDSWLAAMVDHETKLKNKRVKAELQKAKAVIKQKQLAMDSFNRYSIFARGISSDVYGILKTADIVEEFETLLKVTMPSPSERKPAIKHMWPFERLESSSDHMAWMSVYVGDDDNMEVDGQ